MESPRHLELESGIGRHFQITYSAGIAFERWSRHYHDAYELVYYHECAVRLGLNGREYEVGDHNLIFICPFELHTFSYIPNTPYARYVVNFSKAHLLRVLEAVGMTSMLEQLERADNRVFPVSAADGIRIVAMLRTLYELFRGSANAANEARIKSNLVMLLIELGDHALTAAVPAPESGGQSLAQRFARYIDEHFAERLTLDMLADAFFLNRYYVCHSFRREMGMPFSKYLQRRRVIHARELLLTTERKIYDVCFDCGFSSLQHFYRVFEEFTHLSPGDFRRRPLSVPADA